MLELVSSGRSDRRQLSKDRVREGTNSQHLGPVVRVRVHTTSDRRVGVTEETRDLRVDLPALEQRGREARGEVRADGPVDPLLGSAG